ncbi:DUF1036 domain-containing protein [Rhodoplanes sp. Z2-YC6860]|uniref:DUF1036 domain-containing protein n=1 Tax=Rhodoplanes sp. Z2-YC6860 TaxID=674703 RepID=UPI00083059E1|nr:DUF1036 domain-containing protein [Rhodoplanes sp. Z2-YC6860]
MTAQAITRLTFALAALATSSVTARADLQICSRMSYVVETAIAIEDKGAAATRGWFRIDPGQCRTVIQGDVPGQGTGQALYIHARALPIYGGSPLPQNGHAEFCIGSESFVLTTAQSCNRTGQRMARFTAVKPSPTDKGLAVYLAEDAEYTDEQARDAGIQRLLVIAGYDANPIDGIRAGKTDVALAQFIIDNKLENTAAGRQDFFDVLMAAAQKPSTAGFSWCNETRNTVMAAVGVEEQGNIVTRGWYRVAPGKCLRPDVSGKPRRLYSFGEAIGPDNQPLRDPARTAGQNAASNLSWGGSTILCTRSSRFELSDHRDCGSNGLTATGFATVELSPTGATTVQFK